ncbi:MAG: methylenetetrahydrofolate reductase C-terminal domain-containing protein [Spirochaetota bacterium]
MVVNVPKPNEELIEMLNGYNDIFIVACGGCPVGCDSGGQKRIDELSKLLNQNGKKVTGDVLIDFLCNKALVGNRLRNHINSLEETDAILVVSCGIGVQATANMVDLPSLPANDTLSSQGMQGLWPSNERCAGCGTCYLALTGGICPITSCSKSLLNGMCGGQHDGLCEVEEKRDCGWYLIFKRLEALGKLDNLKKIPKLRDFRNQDVPDKERHTTRWAIEKEVIYEAPKKTQSVKEG